MIAVIYLYHSEGPSPANMKILNDLSRTLTALGRPFVVLGDWNMEPAEVVETNWIKAHEASFTSTAQPTCRTPTQNGTTTDKEYDYAVVSHHWNQECTATLNHAINFTPHSGVTICLPGGIKNQLVETLKRPAPFPRESPYGPFLPPKSTDGESTDHNLKTLDEHSTEFYRTAEEQLATAYGICLDSQPKFKGREFLSTAVTTTKPALTTRRGNDATPHDAHMARVIAARLAALIRIRDLTVPSTEKIKERILLEWRIPRVHVSQRAVFETEWITAPRESLVNHAND